jgi:hypothetical protein
VCTAEAGHGTDRPKTEPVALSNQQDKSTHGYVKISQEHTHHNGWIIKAARPANHLRSGFGIKVPRCRQLDLST